MRTARRWALVAAAAMVLAGTTTACSEATNRYRDDLSAAISRTEQAPRKLVYTQSYRAESITVRAAVADDLRYKADVEVGGVSRAQEVARDDALAMRFGDPAVIDLFRERPNVVLTQGPEGSAPNTPSVANPGAAVVAETKPLAPTAAKGLEALRSRRWVLDRTGAPDLFATDRSSAVGDDVVLDALSVLSYVRQTVNLHQVLTLYNPDSTSYRPKEDPFPRPAPDSGVDRYDVFEPGLPQASQTNETGSRQLPDSAHFRKMSVYVKDGYVIGVREQIDLIHRLDDLAKAYKIKYPEGRSDEELEIIALQSLNAMRLAEGHDPIRLRSMAVEFSSIGQKPDIALPGDAVPADLSALRRRGTANVNVQASTDTAAG